MAADPDLSLQRVCGVVVLTTHCQLLTINQDAIITEFTTKCRHGLRTMRNAHGKLTGGGWVHQLQN